MVSSYGWTGLHVPLAVASRATLLDLLRYVVNLDIILVPVKGRAVRVTIALLGQNHVAIARAEPCGYYARAEPCGYCSGGSGGSDTRSKRVKGVLHFAG